MIGVQIFSKSGARDGLLQLLYVRFRELHDDTRAAKFIESPFEYRRVRDRRHLHRRLIENKPLSCDIAIWIGVRKHEVDEMIGNHIVGVEGHEPSSAHIPKSFRKL